MPFNRRQFLGSMVAAAACGPASGGMLKAQSGAASKPRSGQWTRGGFVDAGGLHEPYMFVVRRGGQRRDAAEISARQQSPETIRRLHEIGIEVFHTHLYKGFGMEAEHEEMEETRKAVAFAHGLGMKADTYIQWSSLMYETFFAEEPRAEHWIQRNALGQPVMLGYGFEQSWRFAPCFSNQEYLDYLKRVVHYAIVDVKTDFIHFDNFGLNPEPDSCHCPHCAEGFRRRLKTKYTPEQLRERLGFARVDFISPPLWNLQNGPSKMDIISDPVFQEWADYRCQSMSDALKQMYDYAYSLNPEVAIEINPKGITGENLGWLSGIDHARLLPMTSAFWSEEGNTPSYLNDGQLISRIRSYKLARAYGNVLMEPLNDDPLSMAESLAFNQTPSYVGDSPLEAATLTYINFYRQNRQLYMEAEDVAAVAVFRSFPSITYHHAAAQLSAILVEQTLIQSQIPFRYVFDAELDKLHDCKVLILPDSECLSDSQIDSMRHFVESGGSLVVLGDSGTFDEWRRVRTSPGLAGLVKYSMEQGAGAEQDVSRNLVGQGRVAYLKELQFDGPLPGMLPDFSIRNEFWKVPKNSTELLDLVHWAAADEMPLMVKAPDYVAVNLVSQAAQRRWVAHLVNYAVENGKTVEAAPVSVVLPAGCKAKAVTAYSPEWKSSRTLKFVASNSRASFVAPEIKTYVVIEVAW